MIEPTLKLDTSGLEKQVQRVFLQGKKTMPDIVNQRLLNVAGRAFNDTKMADKAEIIRQLGEIGRQVVVRNGKPTRGKKRIYVQAFGNQTASRIELIINSRRGKMGLPGLEGKPMEKEIIKVLAARKRAVGFERSAYLPGIRALAAALPKPFIIARRSGISEHGRAKGEGRAAKGSLTNWNVEARIVNNAKNIAKVDGGVLQRALNTEASELQRHLDKDLKPIEDAFNKPI